MLGEQIGELHGKIVLRRVLSSDPLRVEVTVEDRGKILEVEVSDFESSRNPGVRGLTC